MLPPTRSLRNENKINDKINFNATQNQIFSGVISTAFPSKRVHMLQALLYFKTIIHVDVREVHLQLSFPRPS
jgi:hypothetical protein